MTNSDLILILISNEFLLPKHSVSRTHQELEDVCYPVINKPKPTVEEAPEVNDPNSGAHNGPTAKQGAEGKGDAKGSQQTKPGTKEMEVD